MSRQFEPGRALEVVSPKYGSAYRIGGRLVLTAAHLLGQVGADCRVRAKQSFGEVSATVVWRANAADIALIELSESVPAVESAVLGQLPEGSAGEKVGFQMYGYPQWGRTQREGGKSAAGGRQIEGMIYLADCSPDGLLVLEAERLPPEARTERSQWEGASGGAIVCDGVVVGVQSQHQNPNRPASLEAAPIWMVYEDERWCELLRQHGISSEPAIARITTQEANSLPATSKAENISLDNFCGIVNWIHKKSKGGGIRKLESYFQQELHEALKKIRCIQVMEQVEGGFQGIELDVLELVFYYNFYYLEGLPTEMYGKSRAKYLSTMRKFIASGKKIRANPIHLSSLIHDSAFKKLVFKLEEHDLKRKT